MKINGDVKDEVSIESKYQRKTALISAICGFVLGGGLTFSVFTINYNKQINNNNSINVENKKELSTLQKENNDLNKKIADLSKGIITNEKGLKTGDLMEICPPYNSKTSGIEVYNKKDDKTFSIAGKLYKKGIVLSVNSWSSDQCGNALINLDGKYKTLSFEYGHVDETRMTNSTLVIEDGEREVGSLELIGDNGLNQASFDVSGIKILKIRVTKGDDYGDFGLTNLNIE